MNEKCENCRFWIEADADTHECHRAPPSFVLMQIAPDDIAHDEAIDRGSACSRTAGCWPETSATDWCGEHQPARKATETTHPNEKWDDFVFVSGKRVQDFLAARRIGSFEELLATGQPTEEKNFGHDSFRGLVLGMFRFGVACPPHWKLNSFIRRRLRQLKDDLGGMPPPPEYLAPAPTEAKP